MNRANSIKSISILALSAGYLLLALFLIMLIATVTSRADGRKHSIQFQADSGDSLDIDSKADFALPSSDIMYDSSKIELREIKRADIDKFRNEKDFIYTEIENKSTDLWSIIQSWIYERLYELIYGEDGKPENNLFVYVIALTLVIFIIYWINRSQLSWIFGKSDKSIADSFNDAAEDNIYANDYDDLITKAESENNFRKCVRYQYLNTLKKLADLDLIEWKPDKTNHDYIVELSKKSELMNVFTNLTFVFDYVWYGEFEISHDEYMSIKSKFLAFSNKLQSDAALFNK